MEFLQLPTTTHPQTDTHFVEDASIINDVTELEGERPQAEGGEGQEDEKLLPHMQTPPTSPEQHSAPQQYPPTTHTPLPVPLPSAHCDSAHTRANLLEKHARHIGDLKSYYEAELTHLKKQMADIQLQSSPLRGTHPVAFRRSPSPVRRSDGSGEVVRLRSENVRLSGECAKLQESLNETSR